MIGPPAAKPLKMGSSHILIASATAGLIALAESTSTISPAITDNANRDYRRHQRKNIFMT